ncbi:MAG TPA: thioesterase II family protein [Blastocatellia bacterium]|nr:thioesterase II family protein [Blastocatellia bacterium]
MSGDDRDESRDYMAGFSYEEQMEEISVWPALGCTDIGRIRPRMDRMVFALGLTVDGELFAPAANEPVSKAPSQKMNRRVLLDTDHWITYPKLNPEAVLRLFCFPYAGGGSAIFRSWINSLPDTVEVGLVQLPGREHRISEPPFTQVGPLVEALSIALRPHLDKEFAFFGHSMGAIVSFELARWLRSSQSICPARLFVSGRAAPQVPDGSPPTYNLPEADLLIEVRRLNGTPREVLENRELMRLVLPILRADFELVQTYRYSAGPPLDCSITAFGGLQDKEISREDLEAWREQTNDSFSLHMLPGDHFFINTERQMLLDQLSKELGQLTIQGPERQRH